MNFTARILSLLFLLFGLYFVELMKISSLICDENFPIHKGWKGSPYPGESCSSLVVVTLSCGFPCLEPKYPPSSVEARSDTFFDGSSLIIHRMFFVQVRRESATPTPHLSPSLPPCDH